MIVSGFCKRGMRRPLSWRWFAAVISAAGVLWHASPAAAAETADPVAMTKTLILLSVDSRTPLTVRSSFHESPPTVTLEFPEQQVIGSLPEHSTMGEGAVQAVTARYADRVGPRAQRALQSIQIALRAPYAHHVRSEPGRIVVEIDHPSSVKSAAMEVNVGGVVIAGAPQLSERFRAMQEALQRAAPGSPVSSVRGALQTGGMGDQQTLLARSGNVLTIRQEPSQTPAPSKNALASSPSAGTRNTRSARGTRATFALFLLVGGAAAWGMFRWRAIARSRRRSAALPRQPAGLTLIDDMVWGAFAQQGYGLVIEIQRTQPPGGVVRILQKEGVPSALWCVGYGAVVEQQTVEQFVRIMREAKVEQGMLVAAGSFTVPAQRVAKARRILLIGREQLAELLSEGARGEYVNGQLAQQRQRLDELQATLCQYASELDALRRQRNEASWYFGEERAKSASLEAQLNEAQQQLHQYQTELQRWTQEAATLRKQWEESQWFLGEAQARGRYLDAQLAALHAVAQQAQRSDQERQEAQWYLGEERVKYRALEAEVAQLQTALEASAQRERELEHALQQLRQAVETLAHSGERRLNDRVKIPGVIAEIYNGEQTALAEATIRDVSCSGIGLETAQELPEASSLRIRLSIPGCDAIDSPVRLVWQRQRAEGSLYHSGCTFADESAQRLAQIAQLIEQIR